MKNLSREKQIKKEVRKIKETIEFGKAYLNELGLALNDSDLETIEALRVDIFLIMTIISKRWMSKKQFKRLKQKNQEGLRKLMGNFDKLHSHLFMYLRKAQGDSALRADIRELEEPILDESGNLQRNYDGWNSGPLEHSKDLIRYIKDLFEPI